MKEGGAVAATGEMVVLTEENDSILARMYSGGLSVFKPPLQGSPVVDKLSPRSPPCDCCLECYSEPFQFSLV